jgi:hypothetical protein
VPDAFEPLKARINFDLTGKNAEKRMGYGALGVTIGCVILGFRFGGRPGDFVAAGVVWLLLMAVFGIGLLVTRKRNAKFAARLRAAGFTPVHDENGRLRYLPPGAQQPGQGNPFAGGPYGAVPGQPGPATGAPAAYGQQTPGPYAQPAPGPYPGGPAQAPYGAQPPHAPHPGHPAQAPYGGQPAQAPYGGQPAQAPYGGPAPQTPYPGQPAPGPYGAQPPGPYGQPYHQPHPQQAPHGQQPPRH